MLDAIAESFASSGFMPHGYCFLWTPSLLWTYVTSDFIIASSYFSIPFALWYFVQKRRDLPFRRMFLMFGAFVMACGSVHVFAIWNIWHADYWADAGIKAFTAIMSATTAILLWSMIPKALTVPTHGQLENANRDLLSEVMLRKRAENALREANEALGRRVAERTAELETANSSLRESEMRFRSLTEMSSDWYWEQDRELRLTFLSSGFDRHSGTSSDKLLGKRRWEEPNQFPLRGTWVEHRAVLDAHEPFRNFEYLRIRDDGEKVFVSLSGVPIYDAAGNFSGYRGVGTNISERTRAEHALRAAEEQFRGLVEQSIAGTYIIQDDRFAYVNPRFAKIFGYASAEEMIGREAPSLVAENDRNAVVENIRRQIIGKSAIASYDFTGVRKDGSTIDVGVHGARATHRGRPAIIGLLQDISEKKRAEEQIRRHMAQLETAFMSTVQVATTLSEMRDPYTAGHERRVAEIAVAIGAELGFDARRLEGLRVAGYLHDVGKITIPAEILAKPGKLTPIEFQLIKGHAQASYDVLKAVEFPWPVAGVALQHHERIDGSGYPQGLEGEAILIEARIMAVADVVEAMSSHRPYRPGLGIEVALAEIERGRGTSYDADAVDACLRLFREKHYQFPA